MELFEGVNLVIQYVYLASATLFIFGIKLLGSPATARRGNFLAALGMFIAIVATLVNEEVLNYEMIAAGIAIGAVIGAVLARTIKMTAMPQMVAIFNGVGGGASAVIAVSEFVRITDADLSVEGHVKLTIMLGVLIGFVTLTGSLIAFGKLQELLTGRPITYPLQNIVSGLMFLAVVGMIVYLVGFEFNIYVFYALVAVSLILGIQLVIPIGGADMPVVISLLNSYSGVAAAAAGFALGNLALIVSGALVGAAGLILTNIMTKAMNRSLANVVFGAFGAATSGGPVAVETRTARSVQAEDAAVMLAYARSVIFVPGYGLAVAQAQHQVRELADLLAGKGVRIKYAIHPVAGRMPGHMNVLLAEANVPYDELYDLDEINDDFRNTDVAVVIGANDVTNPAARDQPDSPVYGMPILNVDMAQHVIVLKRSMSPGFAGIDNDLFFKDNTRMLFGDARRSVTALVSEVKGL
ncbi:MAG: NAD(P)(+) transhydrogenase (Re/Si-specific) subunit beta [Chloroflexota bacterium]|nr:NAD(P)(+) transhydrogenase (Re/Si-specific) subunit beta [Chloroflexota bacterium]